VPKKEILDVRGNIAEGAESMFNTVWPIFFKETLRPKKDFH